MTLHTLPAIRREWVVGQLDLDSPELPVIQRLGLHPVVGAIIQNRFPELCRDESALTAWLNPSLADLPDPDTIPDMDLAARTVADAIASGDRIGIFGDYDVDGISGTALLARFVQESGGDVVAMVPNRSDGYGLNPEGARRLSAAGAKLVITVDNGIAAHAGAGELERLGIPLIITDHHSFDPGNLPIAVSRVHPGLTERQDGWHGACGAGVALALVVAVRRRLRDLGRYAGNEEPDLGLAIQLAALGTVADVVSLQGVNRLLVRAGVERIRSTDNPGISALLEQSGLDRGSFSEESIAFGLGPRINAAGRMADAGLALNLLMTDEQDHATGLAVRLEQLNRARQQQQLKIRQEVEERLASDVGFADRPMVFASDPDWAHGIIGIVAGQLARKYHRPVFLLQVQDNIAKGSARSIDEVDLIEAMVPAREYAQSLGGHAEAAGMTVAVADLGKFRSALEDSLTRLRRESPWHPVIQLDGHLPVSEVTPQLLQDLSALAPFGQGNRRPVFASDGIDPEGARLLKGEHVQFRIRKGGRQMSVIGFRKKHLYPLPPGRIRLAYRPVPDTWRGGDAIQLQIEDVVASSL